MSHTGVVVFVELQSYERMRQVASTNASTYSLNSLYTYLNHYSVRTDEYYKVFFSIY